MRRVLLREGERREKTRAAKGAVRMNGLHDGGRRLTAQVHSLPMAARHLHA